jgi:WD40 repeat protein/serine/threonine protein kinase
MKLGLLGPLAIERDGSVLEISGPKRRALLVLLALNAGSPVSRDRIIDALWPGEHTGREESTLRVHVSHLRDALEPNRDAEPEVIVTEGSAYMLAADGLDLDLERFDQLSTDGRRLIESEPAKAVELLNSAFEVWRGRPLQDVEYEEFAQDDIRRLERVRLEATEDRAAALVELGEDAAAIDDLEGLVRTHPTRERPVGLLMRALYRTGRQSDSLRALRRHNRALAEQGLEPSPALRTLEDRILQHDATLLAEGTVSWGDVAVGRSVRGYELRAEAGSGSTGVVYRAFQSSVGREVALKLVHPHLAETPEFVRRFAEEAQVIASLEHPHIVPLHDFWRDPAGAFLVMRWMGGGSLEDHKGQRWEMDDIGRIFGQLAEALGYAHSAGIVHRDVKPANVLFDRAGNAYLGDFGLAVVGIDTGSNQETRRATLQPPYASPEVLHGEGPTIASDIYGLGVLLAEAASRGAYDGSDMPLAEGIREVVLVATAPNPADRYPDMAAFATALNAAIGPISAPLPRRVRRNPFKGLAPFGEADSADFYGRDDVVESLVDMVRRHGLAAVVGASGSGKSSLVAAGVVPQLRAGALPGSDEWSIVRMVPGSDPFDEFHMGLRSIAVSSSDVTPTERSRELREAFDVALDGPSSRALLFVDQFEELFSSEVEEATRECFLENLLDLAADPARRIRVVVTLRADFSDRPLAHPRFGDLMSRATMLLAQMRPEQVEEVIRKPAARVGVQVEPGLIAEIVRDVASAPAYLPLLQYVLSELFERRSEDRLTVQAYRALGGVQGVLERRAEATFSELGRGAQDACRELFLRMVQLGDHGEETRRRLPLTELQGLGIRAAVQEALEKFAAARLLTYDRDPVTRTPTIEVAHETVIHRWTRYRVWIDEARDDLVAHRRVAAAAITWADSDEDPAYFLAAGPLAAARDLATSDRIGLNEVEARFVSESAAADDAAREAEQQLEHRSRRRLVVGITAVAMAAFIAVFAGLAVVQRQRANDLAASQERASEARALAAASISSLTSGDPDLSLLLAIGGADLTLDSDEEVLPEVVDALHQAIVSPRPSLVIPGAATRQSPQLVHYTPDGESLAIATRGGGAMLVDVATGEELARIRSVDTATEGIDLHPDGVHLLTHHDDAVRLWDWSGEPLSEIALPGGAVISTASYARDGSKIAIGSEDGSVRVWDVAMADFTVELAAHARRVTSVAFDPTGTQLLTGGADAKALVWNLATGEITATVRVAPISPVNEVAWHSFANVGAVTTTPAEMYTFSTKTGERLTTLGNGQSNNTAIALDPTGVFAVTAGTDGFARIFGTALGGEAAISLPAGGVPVRDAEFNSDPTKLSVATVGVDGLVRIWNELLGSELPARRVPYLFPTLASTPDGSRYISTAHAIALELVEILPGATVDVIDSATGQVLMSRPVLTDAFQRFAAISDDGSLIAYAGPSGDVEVVTVDTGEVATIPDSVNWTDYLSFSSDAALLAGASADGSIAVWDAASGARLQTMTGHGNSNDGPRTAAGSESIGSLAFSERFTVNRVDDAVFHPVSTDVVSAGYDGTVRRWDTTTGEGRVLHTFDYLANSVAWSPDGSIIAAADLSGEVILLDPESGDVIRVLAPVSGAPELRFSPDGRFLAGSGPGDEAQLWDVESGAIVRRFKGAIYPTTAVAFINGGAQLRVHSGEGVDRGYLLDSVDLVALARSEVSRELTEAECQQYLQRACSD